VYFVKRWRIGLLGVLVSAIATAFIVAQFKDAGEFISAMSSARWIYVIGCGFLLLVALLPRAKRWQVLLANALPYWRTFHIMNVAYLVNNVLPLRIGEVARMYLATQADPPVPVFKTLSTVVVERLLDLLAVVVLLGFALAAGDVPVELRAAGGTAAVLSIGGFLLLVFLANRRALAERLIHFMMERISLLARLKVDRWMANFLDGLMPITAPRTLAQVLFWTVLSWGISVFAGYILMFAFYERADHLAVTCLYIVSAAFAIAVPAVPGNLGTYELSIMAALNAFGYGADPAVSAAFALVVHGVNLVAHCGAGVIGFVQEGISLERLSQGVREIRQNTS
jgi:glycosyltransferase 2 family protein